MQTDSMDIEKVRDFLQNKEKKREEKLYLQWQKARSDFERITNHIASRYHPDRIYQWGSLLDFKRFSEISDIDIAMEGVADIEEFHAILGDCMTMTSFPLDIIRLDRIDPATAELIRTKGRLVYERENP